MNLQKLLTMEHSEVVGRGMHAVAKVIDRINQPQARPNELFSHVNLDRVPGSVSCALIDNDHTLASDLLLQHFHHLVDERLFAGLQGETIAGVICETITASRNAVIESADAICNGEIEIMGYGRLAFNTQIDWHSDQLTKRRAPMVHWTRLDALDTTVVGDHKVVWELNRHQWLLVLGQAFRFTGDEKYAEVFANRIRAWMSDNPPGMGINWSSSLEVSFRAIAWCWALQLFRHSNALNGKLFAEMTVWLRLHARHIERYPSLYYSPNTHLTGEALGLLYLGLLFPFLSESDNWLAQGIEILTNQIELQIYPDGVYFEQSTRYQFYTVEIYLQFLILCETNGIVLSTVVRDRLERAIDFLLEVSRPDSSMPQIGDADGGWLLPLCKRAPDDCRGLFAVAACMFQRDDFAVAARGVQPEMLWLLGRTGQQRFLALDRAKTKQAESRLFPYGGYHIMRNGWHNKAHQLIADVGPLGCRFSAGHGHADMLSFQCSAFGESFLVDPGTFCYSGDQVWRDHFRSSAAHNTVTLDAKSQVAPAGTFAWRGPRRGARLNRRESTRSYEMIEAEHDNYSTSDETITHRRRIVFVRSEYWIVIDDVLGDKKHRVDLNFQFSPVDVRKQADAWVRATGRRGAALLIQSFCAEPMEMTLVKGQDDPIRGWYSPDYGQRVPAASLRYSVHAELPLRIVTLIVPVTQADRHVPHARAILDHHVVGLAYEFGRDTVWFDDHDLMLEAR